MKIRRALPAPARPSSIRHDIPIALALALTVTLLRLTAFDFETFFRLQAVVGHDTLSGASLFAASLHSMRLTGDLAWWLPGPEGGYAQYYNTFLSPLAPTSGNPVFILWTEGVRLLSLFGLAVPEYIQFLVFNYVLTPILAYAALILLCRTFCRGWVGPTMACVVYAYGGPGLWNNAWMFYQEWANIFFFLWALETFRKVNTGPRFAMLGFSVVVMLSSTNYWTVFSAWFVIAWLAFSIACFRASWRRTLRYLRSHRRAPALAAVVLCVAVVGTLWIGTLGLVAAEEGPMHIRRPPPFGNSYGDVEVYWRADTNGVRGWTSELFNPIVERPIQNYKALNEIHNARYIGIGLLPLLLVFLAGRRWQAYDRLLFSMLVVLISISATSGVFIVLRRLPAFTAILHIFYFYQYFLQLALALIGARALDRLTAGRFGTSTHVGAVCGITGAFGAAGLAYIFLNSEQFVAFDLKLKSIGYASILLITASMLVWRIFVDGLRRAAGPLSLLFLLFMTGDLLHYYMRGSLADQTFTRSTDLRNLPPVLPTYMQEALASAWSVRDPGRFDGGLFDNLPIKNSLWQNDEFNPSIYDREFKALSDADRQGATPTGVAMLAEDAAAGDGSRLRKVSATGISAAIVSWGYNEAHLDVTSDRAGLIVTPIAYDAGWHVRVDGTAVEPTRANVKFLAFPIGEGRHSVSLVFWPLSRSVYIVARYATLIALGLLFVLAIEAPGAVRRRRAVRPAST